MTAEPSYPGEPGHEAARLSAPDYFSVDPEAASLDSDEWTAVADFNARQARIYDGLVEEVVGPDWARFAAWRRERARKAREMAALEERRQTEYEAANP